MLPRISALSDGMLTAGPSEANKVISIVVDMEVEAESVMTVVTIHRRSRCCQLEFAWTPTAGGCVVFFNG